MIRAGLIAGALCLPVAALAQTSPYGSPRAMSLSGGVFTYLGMEDTARYGTPDAPMQGELGLALVMHVFGTVCLGAETGAPLAAILPDGFASYDESAFFWGETVPATEGDIVLSPTGSIDEDEETGRPFITLRPRDSGMICRIDWQFPNDLPEPAIETMAFLIDAELPYRMALVRNSRPLQTASPVLSDTIEWDRPCGGRWCPMSALYVLNDLSVSFETTLNITGIGGTQP